jgi:hypothetical protein
LDVAEELLNPLAGFCSSFTGYLARCACGGSIEIISYRCHELPP